MKRQQMPCLSLTPQKKLHNYLQRIDKLLNNRSKSPIHSLSKSRISTVKSSYGIKTTNLDKYLKYEKSFKFFVKFIQNHNRNVLKYFIQKLILTYEQDQVSSNDRLIYHKQSVIFQQQNDNKIFKIIILTIKTQIIKQLSYGFNQIKLCQINGSPLKNNHILYRSRRSNSNYDNLTKNYSSIYLETLRKNLSKDILNVKYEEKGKFQSKYSQKYSQKQRTISPFQQFQSRTPEKYDQMVHSKKIQHKNSNNNGQQIYVKLIIKLLESKYEKVLRLGFQKFKTYYLHQQILQKQRFKYQSFQKQLQKSKPEHQKKQKSQQKHTTQLQYYKKQLQNTTLTIIQFKKIINDQNQTIQFLHQRINKIQRDNQGSNNKKHGSMFLMKNNSVHNICKFMQRKVRVNALRGFMKVKEFHERNKYKQVQFEKNQLNKKNYQRSKILNMKTILSFKLKLQLKIIFQKIKFQSAQSFKSQKNEDQIRTTNPRQVVHTEDLNSFADKINKAFQLKLTLKKVYLNAFQKIDQFAFLSITLSSPFQKIMKRTLSQSLKQIKFFILLKCDSQQKSFNKYTPLNNLIELKKCERQTQKLTNFLKKSIIKCCIQKLMLTGDFLFIFSEIKLYNSFKYKNNNQNFLNEDTLKRELNEFFEQRQRIRQKTLNSWNRTKQILDEPTFYQSRVQ